MNENILHENKHENKNEIENESKNENESRCKSILYGMPTHVKRCIILKRINMMLIYIITLHCCNTSHHLWLEIYTLLKMRIYHFLLPLQNTVGGLGSTSTSTFTLCTSKSQLYHYVHIHITLTQYQINKNFIEENKHLKKAAISRFMFYMAFENSLEAGYVTEKPFDALLSGALFHIFNF